MQPDAYPYIGARWIEQDGQCWFETATSRVDVDPTQAAAVRRLYRLANGRIPLERLAGGGLDLDDVVQLMKELERYGIAHDYRYAAMHGHRQADFPNRARIGHVRWPPPRSWPPASWQRRELDISRTHGHRAGYGRRSARAFNGEAVPVETLEDLTACAYGEVEPGHRGVPSAGAFYPLLLQFLLVSRETVHVLAYALEQDALAVAPDIDRDQVASCFSDDAWVQAGTLLVIGFDIEEASRRYGSRAHRFALLEAGHVVQNLSRRCEELGLSCCEYGAYLDLRLEQALSVGSPTTGIATVVLLGGQA